MECNRCKVSSPLHAFFIKKAKGRFYCPTCNEDDLRYSGILIWLAILIGIPVGHIFLNYGLGNFLVVCLLAIVWFSLLSYLAIIAHELGHFFAARALGGICPMVIFGEGPIIFSVKSTKTIWRFSLSPTLGLAYAIFPFERNESWRLVVMLGAGAFVNLVLVVCSLYFFLVGFGPLGLEPQNFIWLLNAITNILFFICSIFVNPKQEGLVADGRAILSLLKGQRSSSRDERWSYEMAISHALIARDEHALLFDQVRASGDYKMSAHHMSALSYAYALDCDYEEFLIYAEQALMLLEEKGEESLITGAHKDYMRAILMSNVAYALYCTHSNDTSRMLDLANKSYDSLPWLRAIVGTYAAVLIRTSSNVYKGVKKLEKIIRKPMDASDHILAINYACLAEGYEKLEQFERAKEARARACLLDPKIGASLVPNQ